MHFTMVLAVLGLGVAGFDPFGALLVAAALALGATRSATLAFLAASAVVPLAFAVLAGHALGPVEAAIQPWVHLPALVWAAIRLGVGLGLIGWAAWRARHPMVEKPTKAPKGISTRAMAAAGLGFGVTVLLDPAYYAAIAVVARVHPPWLRVALLVVWFAVAQIALIALVAVDLIRPGADLGVRLQRAWRRASPAINRVITVVALVAGVALAIDGLWWFVVPGR